nr:efflux RND transporter permease subunit [uncultured Desulfobacter sp.]
MRRILAAFAGNSVFANIFLVLVLIAGTIAAVSMVRENFPEFSVDMISISITYPGADPEEVEEGISRKIEEALEGVQGVKQCTTESRENSAVAFIEVQESYDIGDVLGRVRAKVDAISTFPKDAEKPVITELTVKEPVVILSLSGNMSERGIKEWAERIKNEIRQIPELSQVTVFGARNYEIAIEVSEERLREYNLTFDQVVDAVRRSNLNLSGGTIRSQGEEIRVRTLGRKYTDKELSQVVVIAGPGGQIITLDRLAVINDGFTEDPVKALINGEPSVVLITFKTKEEDALAISRAVQNFVSDKQRQLPPGANLKILYDNTDMLRDRIDLLLKNGAIGMLIVFIIFWLFLDGRLSFWCGMGIPISIFGALAIVWAAGGTINMVSLFGLILVLGIIVDDAIVVGEAIYVHRKNGLPPLNAAVEGVCEVGMPVTAAVLTTMVTFLPLACVGGVMGKFIAILPAVVISCLGISLVECMILLPAHLSNLPDPNINHRKRNPVSRAIQRLHRMTAGWMAGFVGRIYTPFLGKSLYWRYITFCLAVAVLFLTIGLVRGGFIKFEVFPEVDGHIMTATLEFTGGTPAQVTEDALHRVDAALLRLAEKTDTLTGEPLLKNRIFLLGQTLEDYPRTGPHLGSVQATLLPAQHRGIHAKDLMVAWEKEIGKIPGIQSLIIAGHKAGPPGSPIEVWIQGHEMDRILAAADDLKKWLSQFEGVYQIRSDYAPGKNEMQLTLKPESRTLGLTVEDLARQVYAGYFGDEAVRLQRGRDDIRVKVRYTTDERRRLTSLDRMRIRTPLGHEVPLTSVADVSSVPGYATIVRTDGMRRVVVSADVDTVRVNANEIFAAFKTGFFHEMKSRYPGLHVALQGEQKKMRESLGSLFIGFPLAMAGIFIIIAAMFRSYAQTFVIMFTVPFGVIGAVFGHILLGYPLTMVSLFGIVALAGVVVNDAIVLIERVNENLAAGMAFFESIIKGGARRFRAIILTTISTAGGLLPLIMEKDLQARALIPMALSLAAGVLFATVLTLVLVPSLLAILSDMRLLFNRLRYGTWPRRVEVEPAGNRRMNLIQAEPKAP